jgi:hypothetical protein
MLIALWVTTALFIATGFCLIVTVRKKEAAEQEAFDRAWERDAYLDQRDEAWAALRGLAVPLGWAYAMNEQAGPTVDIGAVRRFRQYLASIYSYVQMGLTYTDVQMAELRDECALADAPRRMPRYPQVPPYLATPEDVARVGLSPERIAVEDAGQFAQEWRDRNAAVIREEFDAALGVTVDPSVPEGFLRLDHADGRQDMVDLTAALIDQEAPIHDEIAKRLRDRLGEPEPGSPDALLAEHLQEEARAAVDLTDKATLDRLALPDDLVRPPTTDGSDGS